MDENTRQVLNIFDKPKVCGLIGDKNTGKSNYLAFLIETLRFVGAKFNLRTYGLPEVFEALDNNKPIHTIEQLEEVEDSVIILDEAAQLLDVENRSSKQMIEQFLRLTHHNNNFIIMCFLPESVKKFLSNKIDLFMLKKCTIGDAINGSYCKKVISSYSGNERGSYVLNIPKNKVLVYNGEDYCKIHIPYYEEYDVKKDNKPIVEVPQEAKNVA